MGIHWSLPMLDHLLPAPLHSRLSVAQNDPRDPGKDADEFRIFDGVSGKVMKAMPLPRTIRVSRRKMRELLCEGLEENIKVRCPHLMECCADKSNVLTVSSTARH